MWWRKPKDVAKDDIDTKLNKIGKDIDELIEENEKLKKELNVFNNDIAACTPMIDFDNMRVCSIERLVYNERPATIIGHYMYEPIIENSVVVGEREKLKEWTLYCNNERHEELVKEFKAWKAKQNA